MYTKDKTKILSFYFDINLGIFRFFAKYVLEEEKIYEINFC